MKILFDTNIKDATITATPSNINYPASNIQNDFLRKRYRPGAASAEVTFTLDSAISMDSFFYGYHNISLMIVKLYDASDVLLQTLTLYDIDGFGDYDGSELLTETSETILTESGDPILVEVDGVGEEIADIGRVYFNQIDGVKKIVATIEADSGNVFLGGSDFGVAWEDRRGVVGTYADAHIDNSEFFQSATGQNVQNYIEPLKQKSYPLAEFSNAQRKELEENYKSTGRGRNLYFDIFDDDLDYEGALYGFILEPVNFSRVPRIFNTNLTIREAR